MYQNKKLFTLFLITLTLTFIFIILLGSLKEKNKKTEVSFPILFYSNNCPHCKELEKWMEENNLEEKTSIIKKEVDNNKSNITELNRLARNCGLKPNEVGVPFLFTPERQCLVGSLEIVEYFKTITNTKK